MKRRHITILAAMSLALCVAIALLWFDSKRNLAGIGLGISSTAIYGAIAHDGTLWLGVAYEQPRSFVNTVRRPIGAGDKFGPTVAGFGWMRDSNAYFLGLPFWMLLPAAAGLSIWLWRARPPKHAAGVCRRCGYDLRATPDRCPECGAAVTPAD